MDYDADYAAIRDGLRFLRESGAAAKVFGGEAHGFCTHPPLTEEAVRAFEGQHCVRLPADYRGFLIHVGNGGAGPEWGLFRLGEMDDAFDHKPWKEGDGFVGILSKPFPHVAAWNDSNKPKEPDHDQPQGSDPEWDAHERQMEAYTQNYWNPDNVNGAIPICHIGCNLREWLVVSGPEAGHVWRDARADFFGLEPRQRKGRNRVTFLEWYTDWLNYLLEELRPGT